MARNYGTNSITNRDVFVGMNILYNAYHRIMLIDQIALTKSIEFDNMRRN